MYCSSNASYFYIKIQQFKNKTTKKHVKMTPQKRVKMTNMFLCDTIKAF